MELLHYGTEYVFPLGLEPKTLKSGVITATLQNHNLRVPKRGHLLCEFLQPTQTATGEAPLGTGGSPG